MRQCIKCGTFANESAMRHDGAGGFFCSSCATRNQPLETTRRATTSTLAPPTPEASRVELFAPTNPEHVAVPEKLSAIHTRQGETSRMEEIKRAPKELWWLWLLVSYLGGLPLLDVLTKALTPGEAGPEEAATIGSMLGATFPLALSAAIIRPTEAC